MSDANTEPVISIQCKKGFRSNSVLPEEINLVQAHLGELLKLVMQYEED